jgi:hypothetical protein
VNTVVGVAAVATTLLLLWGLLAPRGNWSSLVAWSTSDPRAAEPGWTSYLVRRLLFAFGLLGLVGLGTAVVVTWLLNPPLHAPPPTPVQLMWGPTAPVVVDRVISPIAEPPAGYTEVPVLGYQAVNDDDDPGDYLRFLEPFELLGGEKDMPGLIGQDPGDGYSAMDTAELILNVRGPVLCIPRGAIIKETLDSVTVAVYYGMPDQPEGTVIDNAVSCPADAPVTTSVLLAIELHEELGARQVIMLNGDEVPEVELIEPED